MDHVAKIRSELSITVLGKKTPQTIAWKSDLKYRFTVRVTVESHPNLELSFADSVLLVRLISLYISCSKYPTSIEHHLPVKSMMRGLYGFSTLCETKIEKIDENSEKTTKIDKISRKNDNIQRIIYKIWKKKVDKI